MLRSSPHDTIAMARAKQLLQQAEEIDVAGLHGQEEKVKMLMRRDPRFIGRLIEQLDRQMHARMLERRMRQEERRADQEAIDRIDATICNNVQPCLDRLSAEIARKTQLRQQVSTQLEVSTRQVQTMSQEAAALMSKARHTNSKLQARTAQAALQEARGFTATVPTTELIKGKRGATAAANRQHHGGNSSISGGEVGKSRQQ